MVRPQLFWAGIPVTLSFFILYFQGTVYAQLQYAGNSSTYMTPATVNNIASVSPSITVQGSNETLKVKEATLKNSAVDLLNGANDVLKTSDSDQVVTKTNINQKNNSRQNVESKEATNPTIEVETAHRLYNASNYNTPTKLAVNFTAAGDFGCNNTNKTISHMSDKNPLVVLGLGDFSYANSEECWTDIANPLLKKMKVTLGNHDSDLHSQKFHN